jgi:hypothetical protein
VDASFISCSRFARSYLDDLLDEAEKVRWAEAQVRQKEREDQYHDSFRSAPVFEDGADQDLGSAMGK